jgi:hypothetical protein
MFTTGNTSMPAVDMPGKSPKNGVDRRIFVNTASLKTHRPQSRVALVILEFYYIFL